MAIRGERLVLIRGHLTDRHQGLEAFLREVLAVVEINADERIVALVSFDLDEIDAAFEELDARYLAGEASAYAHTWSLVAAAFAAINRHEFPELTPDWVNIDHRRGATFATGDMTAYLNDLLDDTPDINVYGEAVHRLNNLGAVITQVGHGTSQQGFQAEWREIGIFTFDGDLLSRYELFDEADLATALARFEQLGRPASRLENSATRVWERLWVHFAARDWDATTEVLADDISTDDRRPMVGAGVRHGRDAEIANLRAIADIGITSVTSTVIATRGERLALSRDRFSRQDQEPGAFPVEVLAVVEINADNCIAAGVAFEPDDIEAAFEELDARFLAGEGAAHANTWSVIAAARAALIRHELPPTTPDWVNLDHRRGIAFPPGDFTAYLRAGWDQQQGGSTYIDAVHQLNDLGAVFTQVVTGTSQDGFDAEWRVAELMTVEGGLVNRAEFFDDADLDAALAKLEQLSRPAPQLENAASQAYKRFKACFTARDWDGIDGALADDVFHDDRRWMTGAGLREGRDAVRAEFPALAEIGVKRITSDPVATRGRRLLLSRSRASGRDQRPDAFRTDVLNIVEIDTEEKITALITFDSDDFEAAIAELDARYLAGEAADHAHTWSVITSGHAVLNRRELPPTTTDLVSIDHRRGSAFAPGEGIAYLRAGFDLGQDIRTYVEVVHRLSELGAVCTHVGHGVSREGFDAEWRGIDLLTVDGSSVNRCEVFDEADLDAALAAFDQLSPPAPRLENTVSQLADRVMARFTAREWNAAAEMVAVDFSSDDRRRTVNAGIRLGRDAAMKDAHANADVGAKEVTSTVVATRGERLVLRRARYSSSAQRPEAFYVDALSIYEINGDGRLTATVTFDIDDIDAAFEELDARYLAGAAARYAHTWSAITSGCGAFKRNELPPMTPSCVTIDHRRASAFAPGDFSAYLLAGWDLEQDMSFYIETVHRLSDLGGVITGVGKSTSQGGFDAEWRTIDVLTFEGDMLSRCELFDEADLDAALARFEELRTQTPRLKNAQGGRALRGAIRGP